MLPVLPSSLPCLRPAPPSPRPSTLPLHDALPISARAILKGTPLAIDLGAVQRADETHYFAVCCGTGFDAALMAATGSHEKWRWKMAAYVARAFAALPRVTSPLHRVTVDGVTRELPAAMVLVANCGELIPPFLKLSSEERRVGKGSES